MCRLCFIMIKIGLGLGLGVHTAAPWDPQKEGPRKRIKVRVKI